MKRILTIALWLSARLTSGAEDLVIQAIDQPGRIVFSEVPAALGYRVEWASEAMKRMAGVDEVPNLGNAGNARFQSLEVHGWRNFQRASSAPTLPSR